MTPCHICGKDTEDVEERFCTQCFSATLRSDGTSMLVVIEQRDDALARLQKAIQCHGDIPCGGCVTCLNGKLQEAEALLHEAKCHIPMDWGRCDDLKRRIDLHLTVKP